MTPFVSGGRHACRCACTHSSVYTHSGKSAGATGERAEGLPRGGEVPAGRETSSSDDVPGDAFSFNRLPACRMPRLLSSSTRGVPPRWSPAQPSPLRPGWPTLTRAPEPPRGHPPRAFRSSRRPLPLLSASQSRFPRRSVFHSAGPERVSGIYEGFTEGLEPVQRRRVAATPPGLPTSPASGLTFLLHVLSEAELGSTAQRRRIGKDAAGGVKTLRADHPCYARRC